MNSLAIWYKGCEPEKEIDVHLNLWKLPSTEREGRFLDIGLNLHNSTSIDEIFIYIPFAANSKNIYDLGRTIGSSSPRLLTAIFNEDYRITASTSSDYFPVKDKHDNEVFNVYAMDETNYKLEEKHNGTIIKITLPQAVIRQKKTYLRFRITGPNLTHFSRIERDVSSILSNAFNKNEILDFRVNSARHLPNKLLEEIAQDKTFNIKKIHFFYICSYCEDYTLSHQPFHSVRKLEDGVWGDYIQVTENLRNLNPKETFIAYHWKDKETDSKKVDDFNVFLKTNFRDKNWTTIGKYMLYLILFAVCTGLLSNYIFSKIQNFKVQTETVNNKLGMSKKKKSVQLEEVLSWKNSGEVDASAAKPGAKE
ncbi:MAG: hypothetical protein ACWGKN_07875 [Desulfoprunum sp.]